MEPVVVVAIAIAIPKRQNETHGSLDSIGRFQATILELSYKVVSGCIVYFK